MLGIVAAVAACERVTIEKRDEHGMTRLMHAAQRGDSTDVERLIGLGADVNAEVPTRDVRELVAFLSWMQQLPASDIGYAALHYAAAGQHAGVAQQLLGHGANANHAARGGTMALDLAVFHSDTTTITVLRSGGANIGARQLWTAVGNSTPATVALLLASGARPNDAPPQFARTSPRPPPVAIMAAGHGDTAILGLLIRAGADVKAQDANGWTPLRHARRAQKRSGGRGRDMQPVIAMLEAAGATDKAGELADALMDAMYKKDQAAARRAIADGADPNNKDDRGVPPLVYASRLGLVDVIAALLAARADISVSPQNDVTPLIAAIEGGHTEAVKALIVAGADVNQPDKLRRTPLQVASNWKRTEITLLLLASSAKVDSLALPGAALGGTVELVKALLAAGANPNAGNGHALSEATRGCYRSNNTEVIRVLLEAGADPKLHGDLGPLHRAVGMCDTSVVRMLLVRGADPNLRDLNGSTPLVFAVVSGKIDAVRMLIAAKADVNSRDDDGKSVLAHAARFPEIQAELRRAGAR